MSHGYTLLIGLTLGLFFATFSYAQGGEFGTIGSDIGSDGTLNSPGRIAPSLAGDAPSIGEESVAAGEDFPDVGESPSIGSSGRPVGEGLEDVGESPSIGASSVDFD